MMNPVTSPSPPLIQISTTNTSNTTSSSSLTASSSSSSSSSSLLIPPFRYELVESNLHRGGYPTLRNFPFLARLHLRTIISCTPENPTSDLAQFSSRENIVIHHFPVLKHTDTITITNQTIAQIIALIISVDHHPIYLHCLDGSHVTGLIIMCLRKLQHQQLQSAIAEFRRFIRDHSISTEEQTFLQQFNTTVNIPINLPDWLWNGKHLLHHPTIQLYDPLTEKIQYQQQQQQQQQQQEEQ